MRVEDEQDDAPQTVLVPEYKTVDWALLTMLVALAGFGLVMVFSASIAQADRVLDNPFHYWQNQLMYLGLGCVAGYVAWQLPLRYLERYGPAFILFMLLLLLIVLIPGVGKTVNGSQRWLQVGVSVQPSEAFKLALIIYLAGYLVRKGELLRQSFKVFVNPLIVAAVGGLLLMLEPDFGATVVVVSTVIAMMFVAGARLSHLLMMASLLIPLAAALVVLSPYRFARLLSFMRPWEDPFNSGFQLTQSLIAIGRGAWTGVGLGNSVQKMAYLPEAHTDFVFAVLAEETGFIGVCIVLGLFAAIVYRCFRISAMAEKASNPFGAHLALGIGFWIGVQAFINIGANTGVLPTKGITLPLFSYGGSSAIIMCVTCGILLRVFRESAEVSARDSVREVEQRITYGNPVHLS
jgi:cell division protein FtsW